MYKRGKEDQPVPDNEPANNDNYAEGTYKQSRWSSLIDAALGFGEAAGNQKIVNWAKWMKRDGFRLSDQEIWRKTDELVGMSIGEQKAMIRRNLESVYRNPYDEEQKEAARQALENIFRRDTRHDLDN